MRNYGYSGIEIRGLMIPSILTFVSISCVSQRESIEIQESMAVTWLTPYMELPDASFVDEIVVNSVFLECCP